MKLILLFVEELNEITFNYSTNNCCSEKKRKQNWRLVRRSLLKVDCVCYRFYFCSYFSSFLVLSLDLWNTFKTGPVFLTHRSPHVTNLMNAGRSFHPHQCCHRIVNPFWVLQSVQANTEKWFTSIMLDNLRPGTFSQLTMHNFSISRVFVLFFLSSFAPRRKFAKHFFMWGMWEKKGDRQTIKMQIKALLLVWAIERDKRENKLKSSLQSGMELRWKTERISVAFITQKYSTFHCFEELRFSHYWLKCKWMKSLQISFCVFKRTQSQPVDDYLLWIVFNGCLHPLKYDGGWIVSRTF